MKLSKKMKNLHDRIQTMYETGKLPRGFTPYMVQVVADVYSGMLNCGKAEYIESELADFFSRSGFKTEKHGVGFITYVS